jgi:hypothetical protein
MELINKIKYFGQLFNLLTHFLVGTNIMNASTFNRLPIKTCKQIVKIIQIILDKITYTQIAFNTAKHIVPDSQTNKLKPMQWVWQTMNKTICLTPHKSGSNSKKQLKDRSKHTNKKQVIQ